MHRGEDPEEYYNSQSQKRVDNLPAGMKSKMVNEAFKNEDTTKYNQRLNKFLQG